ncbi:sister chromatid cohesion 1 protein 1 [Pyrus communis]|uniref:sister chromatid cohesion 1 protein 1 n=1 Tax=Pyrus communis TaxID=23211 RepID=UPI0035BEED57
MFYSHQLLARKAPLGQIWRAATMHAKINRRKLDKLDLIKICEEILNPSVPMALRLSGILMGGVVIVYERKVKLLYEDATRLLVELNEAWKTKPVGDPTVLPKGRSQARKEAITLPENEDTEIEGMLNFSHGRSASMQFQQTSYFAMRLDSVDEQYVNNNAAGEEDSAPQLYQADVENITLPERFDPFQADHFMYNRLERFEIEGDEETQFNFTSGEHTHIHIPPSPPRDEYQEGPPAADTIQDDQHPDHQANQPYESKEFRQMKLVQERQGTRKRKTRKQASGMDFEQTIIPGHVYQSWLQDPSDLSRDARKWKRKDVMATMKIANLMDLPPKVLMEDLFTTGSKNVYYPRPLLDMWMKSVPTPHESSADFHSGVGSQSSIDKQRPSSGVTKGKNDPASVFMDGLTANLKNIGLAGNDTNPMVTPGNSDDVRSIPSSASGQAIPSEGNSGRSGKKRPHSASGGNIRLEPLLEMSHPDVHFELSRSPEQGPAFDQELLVETGPTQTQKPIMEQPLDKTTDTIRRVLKSHFETEGAPRVESLDNLTAGRNRKEAAMLFYKTCVLATRDVIRVEQRTAYGEILISRGPKM